MIRKTVDPFDGPSWLAPHKHPKVFSRQIFGIRFRVPNWPAWIAWAATFVLSLIASTYGWTWTMAFPLGVTLWMLAWSGILTNFGKPLQSATVIVMIMVSLQVVLLGFALISLLAMKALGIGAWSDPGPAAPPNAQTTGAAPQ